MPRRHTSASAVRARRAIRFRPMLNALERRDVPALITWDGGGTDLQWTNPLNWSGDALPGPADDVFVDVAGTFTVQYLGGATTIKSLQLSDAVTLKLGSITVTDALTIGAGVAVTAAGNGVTFQASGTATTDGASLIALDGAQVTVTGLKGYAVTANVDPIIQAKGFGSAVNLPALATLKGAPVFRLMQVTTTLGGLISLPALATITGGNLDIKADGGNSKIDAPALTSYAVNPDLGTLTAINNGTVNVPALTKINRVNVTVSDIATLPLAQVNNFNYSGLTVSNGAKASLPALTAYEGNIGSPNLIATGATSHLQFPNLTSIKGAGNNNYVRAQALAGGRLAFASLTSVGAGYVEFKADGFGSNLDLPAFATFAPTTEYGQLIASNNGSLNVPLLTKANRVNITVSGTGVMPTAQITDLTAASVTITAGAKVSFTGVTAYTCGLIAPTLSASGANSRLEFPNLTSLKGGGGSAYLRVHGLAGGRVDLPSVSSYSSGFAEFKADGVNSRVSLPALASLTPLAEFGVMTASAGGTLDVPLLSKINRANVTISGASFMPTAQVTDINLSYVAATAGAKVSFPGVTAYNSGPYDTTIQAAGSGSLLQFPNLTSLKGPSGFTNSYVLAQTGGRLEMPALPLIDVGNVNLRSQGAGSFMHLPALTAFAPVNETGRVTVDDSGTFNAPALTKINRVVVTIGDLATIPTAQITDLNTASVYLTGGAKVSFPGVTNYDTGPIDPYLQASGSGSRLMFPNLSALKGATAFHSLHVNAIDGGRVEFAVLPQIATGVVDFRADGPAAAVDLPVLQSFALTNETGSITILSGGAFAAPQLTKLNRITVSIADWGTMPTAQITDFNFSTVYALAGAFVSLPGVSAYNSGPNDPVFRADGGNSRLSFPNLTSVKGSTLYHSLKIQAQNGGYLEMAVLPTIDTGTVDFRADGGNSVVNLPALAAIALTSDVGTMTANNAGTVSIPVLTTLNRVTLSISDASKVQTAQITDLKASSVIVTDGAVVSLPGVVSYECGPTDPRLEASDAGSRLIFPNLTTLKGASTFHAVEVYALTGGRVELPAVAVLDTGVTDIKADGGNSVIDLSALTTFAPTADVAFLTVSNGGAILSQQLTKIHRVTVTVSSGGSLPTAQITNIDRSSFLATAGADVSLPGVTSFAGADLDSTLSASGAGSALRFPNLTTLKGATNNRYVRTVATAYGRVEIPLIAVIDFGAVEIRASGAGSVVDYSSLKTFAPASDFGQLTVDTSGKVITQPALALQRVTFTTDHTSQVTLTSLDLGNLSLWQGTGTLNANVTNGGDIRPAASFVAGKLTINGNYTQLAAGKISFELLGVLPVSQYDCLAVTGVVSLAGTLATTINFTTAIGNSFTLVENAGAGSVVGTFLNQPEGALLPYGKDYYSLTYKGGDGNDIVLTRVIPGAPRVQFVQVNDGSAQRSRVTSLTVNFDQVVTLSTPAADAFQLVRQSDAATVTVSAKVSSTTFTTVVLTFTGGAVQNGSLADGRYTLTILASRVSNGNGSLDGDGNGTGGDDYVLAGDPAIAPRLFRQFGDSDGDGDVDATDFAAFRAAFGNTSTAFDFDGDGDVDATDFGQFRTRFGLST